MIIEDQLEQHAIQWFEDTGWKHVHGAVIAPEAGPSSQPSPTGRRRKTGTWRRSVVALLRRDKSGGAMQFRDKFCMR